MKRLFAGTLVVFGLAIAVPAGAAPFALSSKVISSQSDPMISEIGGSHGSGMGRGHGNRGRHLGWIRGHHYGWAHSRHHRH